MSRWRSGAEAGGRGRGQGSGVRSRFWVFMALGPVAQAVAEAFLEGDQAQGLADGAQGDEQGVLLGGGVKEAVQAEVEDIQALQEGGKIGLVLAAALQVESAGEMFGVAAQGRDAEAVFFGQGAVGHPQDELAVDLRALGVIADGTTFIHGFPVPGFRFSVKASGQGYQGRGPRGQQRWDE